MSPYEQMRLEDVGFARKCDLLLLAIYMFKEPIGTRELARLLIPFEFSEDAVTFYCGILLGARQIAVDHWDERHSGIDALRWKVIVGDQAAPRDRALLETPD